MGALDLNDVAIFAALAEASTLSAAAKELGVPASTVSRSLSRLEKHLGVSLVRRSTRGITLTDPGREYLHTCRRALRVLKDGGEALESQRAHPRGQLKVVCPITMARDVLAPLMKEFLRRYPGLRVEIEPYSSGWDQEPREDADVFFKLRAPRDSLRRVRPYPGTARGLFASRDYVAAHGSPASLEDLAAHPCIGHGTWKLSRGKGVVGFNPMFCVVTSDPHVHLTLALHGLGVSILPLWMAEWPEVRKQVVPILPRWKPDPISVCALFSGQSRLTPKVQVLLDFLEEYLGTEKDPRLRQKWKKEYFTAVSIPPMRGA
jgi:DNA-binding transcriptional LysR family regulator